MQIDRKTLQGLLSLSDGQLTAVIRNLAASSGLDLSEFNIRPNDIQSIRSALSGATDEDLLKITEQLHGFKKGNR